MKLKVCGLLEPDNIKEVAALKPDFVGFIFYKDSKRFANVKHLIEPLSGLPTSIQKVGVFVKQPIEEVMDTAHTLNLQFVQLHGGEGPDYLEELKRNDIRVIKVFHLSDEFDWSKVKSFEGLADYYLFDTLTPQYGGSGHKFDWKLLEAYDGTTPFLLSGGIDLEDLNDIFNLNVRNLVGIDVNSRFEIIPGIKDISKVKQLIKTVKT